MSRFSKNTQQDPHSAVVKEIASVLTGEGVALASEDMTRSVLSLESLNDQQFGDVKVAFDAGVDHLKDAFRTSLESMGADLESISSEQWESGMIAMMAAGDPSGYAERAYTVSTVSNEGVMVMDPVVSGQFGSLDYQTKASLEAFDESELRKHLPFSVAFNIQAARQDAFAETFYPTTVIGPDQAGLDMSIRRATVFTPVRHTLDGRTVDFDRRNLIEGVADYQVLASKATKAIPVVVSGADSNEDMFVDDALVGTKNIQIDGVSVTTAPLAINKTVGLLGLSQHPGLIEQGIMDHTDALDPALALQNVYVSLDGDDGSGGTATSVLKFGVRKFARSGFNKSVEGSGREMVLNMRTQDLMIGPNTTTVSGQNLSAVPALAAIQTNEWTVRLSVSLNGDADLEVGNVTVGATNIVVHEIRDADGVEIDMTTGDGKTLVDGIQNLQVVGYDLDAQRTNSNRRTRGLQVDASDYTERYTIPLGAPISTPTPVGSSRDGAALSTLVAAARIRNSNNAITSALNYADTLQSVVGAPNPGTMGIEGVGRFLVKPFYEHYECDVVEAMNSTRAHERAIDVQGVLINAIRDIAYRMYRDSSYQAALDFITGVPGQKPKLAIGTDEVILRHLMVTGDARTLGEGLEPQIVSTSDTRMKDKIILSFVRPDVTGADPLTFGTHVWMPELTSTINVSRGGATIKETMVQPRSRHVNNLPIMAVIDVVNLEDALRLKTAAP